MFIQWHPCCRFEMEREPLSFTSRHSSNWVFRIEDPGGAVVSRLSVGAEFSLLTSR
jgi:hypothetical protein